MKRKSKVLEVVAVVVKGLDIGGINGSKWA